VTQRDFVLALVQAVGVKECRHYSEHLPKNGPPPLSRFAHDFSFLQRKQAANASPLFSKEWYLVRGITTSIVRVPGFSYKIMGGPRQRDFTFQIFILKHPSIFKSISPPFFCTVAKRTKQNTVCSYE
jgi:hypothetical protein